MAPEEPVVRRAERQVGVKFKLRIQPRNSTGSLNPDGLTWTVWADGWTNSGTAPNVSEARLRARAAAEMQVRLLGPPIEEEFEL